MKSGTFLFLALLSSCGFCLVSALKCDRTPEGSSANKSPPDGRYRLRIFNDPVRYIPGESYNISLEGIHRFGQITPHKFTGFYLTVEKDSFDPRPMGARSDDEVGRFHITSSAVSKFSEKCQNLVTHTSSFPKNEVLVSWTAPAPGSGCLVFKSTVIEHRDVWFSDDGALSRVLCEDEADSGDTQPIVLEQCMACDEAKYELTFEGLWSRHTHPKDFPDNGWLTKFSDVIGASHTTEFRFWTYGEPASDGLKELAEHGSTRQLETELKDEGEHIRTIIKARGIAYPNVTGKTFAVFRVDSKHHLVSLVSMIYPSPDWFVGVSGLELCLSNGSWVEEKILNLYPYDAGTDSGPSYISSDQPTHPKEAIRRIKPNQPNDPRSPFHDPENKEMKPLARLYLTRQRLYEKNCENQEENVNQQQEEHEEEREVVAERPGKEKCAVTGYGAWSACDAQCGKGKQTASREYINPEAARRKGCTKTLIKERTCQGTESICRSGEDPNVNETGDSDNSMCALTDWTTSECSKPCGKGVITRTRQYRIKTNTRKCQKKSNYSEKLEETDECEGDNCAGNINADREERPDKKAHTSCPVTDWSGYSDCSNSCDLGEQIRVRVPLNSNIKKDANLKKIKKIYEQLKESNGRKSSGRFDDDDDDDEDDEDNDDDQNKLDDNSASFIGYRIGEIADPKHPCYETQLIERTTCGVRNKPCDDDIYGRPAFCKLKPFRGKCQGPVETRWYYNKDKGECGIFAYTGCIGNNNTFDSEEDCLHTCARQVSSSLQVFSLVSYGGVSEKVDCKVSNWKHEPCNATCGEGFRWKYRSVINRPQNGGRPCPRTMVHFERCFDDCGDSRMLPAPAPVNRVNVHHHHQCRYSHWSAWSPCSKSCGDSAVQIRTRTVLNHLNPHVCNERLEERRCEVMPCLVGNGYSYNYRS